MGQSGQGSPSFWKEWQVLQAIKYFRGDDEPCWPGCRFPPFSALCTFSEPERCFVVCGGRGPGAAGGWGNSLCLSGPLTDPALSGSGGGGSPGGRPVSGHCGHQKGPGTLALRQMGWVGTGGLSHGRVWCQTCPTSSSGVVMIPVGGHAFRRSRVLQAQGGQSCREVGWGGWRPCLPSVPSFFSPAPAV